MGFAEASDRAIGTLTFIAPDIVLPRVMEQLRDDLDANALNALTEEDIGIWETPEGTTYVDGMSESLGVMCHRVTPFDSARDADKDRRTEKGQRCRDCAVGG